MLRLWTDCQTDRKRLEQQFRVSGDHFLVPLHQSQALNDTIKSICFEFFHNSLPQLAGKVCEIVTEALNLNFSLPRFRQIMSLIQQQEETLAQYRQHVYEMGLVFEEQVISCKQNTVSEQPNDCLFVFADQGEIHSVKNIQDLELTIEEKSPGRPCQETTTEKTMQSQLEDSVRSSKEAELYIGNGLARLTNFFYSSSSAFNRDDWKTDRKNMAENDKTIVYDESQEIDSFTKKGKSIIQKNEDLSMLMENQMRCDLKRELTINREPRVHPELQHIRYKKLMKDAIMKSKLKIRRNR